MRICKILKPLFVIGIIVFFARGVSGEEDLFKAYGTKNMACAQALERASELIDANRMEEALKEVDIALRADAGCGFACFWRGCILDDLGRLREAVDAYEKAFQEGKKGSTIKNYTIQSAINLGLLYARQKERDKSNSWFSKAIIEDPGDSQKMLWIAYRNMAITHYKNQDYYSAALAAVMAYDLNREKVPKKMVEDYFDLSDKQDTARVLFVDEPIAVLKNGEKFGNLHQVLGKGQPINEKITQLLPGGDGNKVIAISMDARYYYAISADESSANIEKINADGSIKSGYIAGNDLYLATKAPYKLLVMDLSTGRLKNEISLSSFTAPTSFVVYPAEKTAYYPYNDELQVIDLETGKSYETGIPGQVVTGDANSRSLFSFTKPKKNYNYYSGALIIDGYPIFYHATVSDLDWTQTTLFKCYVKGNRLILAEVRRKAASNGFNLEVSPDGYWVAAAGGGGWRPTNRQDGSGYGIAVFSTANLAYLQGFFKTDSYPHDVAFNSVTNQVACISEHITKVYDLTDVIRSIDLKGKFGYDAVWSNNGRFLVIANNETGVSIFFQ